MTRTFKLALLAASLAALPLVGGAASAQSAPTQQNRMAMCNAEAKQKDLSGEVRKTFMSDCLSGKTAEPAAPPAGSRAPATAQAPAPAPAKPEPAKSAAAAPAQPSVPRQAAQPAAPAKAPAAATAAAPAGPIDLNHATAEQLDGLWGVGKVRAAAIIANRPYKSVEDLHARHVVPENVFERIKGQIVAH